MTDVQRAGGIRGDEFDDDAAPRAARIAPVRVALRDDAREPARVRAGGEIEVDEARPRDVDLAHARRGEVELLDEPRRERARLLAERLGEHHREVGAPVAVHRIARAFEHGNDRVGRTELTRGIHQRRTNEIVGHHSEELLLFGALGFDSAGFAAAGLESEDEDLESEDDDFESLDFDSPLDDFESPDDFESLDDFESPPLLPLSDDDDDDAPLSPFADLRGRFWSFFPSLP